MSGGVGGQGGAARGGSTPAEGGSTWERSIGVLESRSIARLLEAADALAKEAPVTLHALRLLEPGRMLAAFSGEVDDVRAALRRGKGILLDDLFDELVLAGPHPALVAAALGTGAPPLPGAGEREGGEAALGLIECASVASGALAADAALKEARVGLVALRTGADMGGKSLVALAGDVDEVESAVSRGASLVEARRHLVRAVVVPRALRAIVAAIGRA